MNELFKKAKEKAEAAKAAAESGDLQTFATLIEESKSLKAQAEAAKDAAALVADLNQPEMPAPLPQSEKSVPEVPEQPPADITAKAVYNMRFGETDKAVKAILTDLHGSDYEWKRATQWNSFITYMRGQERTLDRKSGDLLQEIILTPEYVKKAIDDGLNIERLKSTMVEAVSTLGGNIVPVDFQTRVIERLSGLTVMRGRAQTEQTSRDRIQFPKATGGDDQYVSAMRESWVDETPTGSASETNLTFGLENVPVHTAMGLVPLSKNLLEDSVFNLGAYLVRQFAQAAAINEDNTFLTGTGAGKPQGLLPGSANGNSLTEQNSGAGAALTFAGLIRLTFKIAAQYRQRAAWIANRATYEAIAVLADSDGAYFWTEMRGNNASGTPNTLRGYPVLEQEAMPDIAANAYPILFGDPEAYMIVDRVGMSVQRYDVNPGENIVKYEMRRRLGGQTVEPWRMAVQKVAS